MQEHDRAVMRPEMALRVACHEAGHAVVAWHGEIFGEFSVDMPTATSGRGSLVWAVPSDPGMRLKVWLEQIARGPSSGQRRAWDYCAVLLGGLAGEGVGMRVVRTSGAESDLMEARNVAETVVSAVGTAPPWEGEIPDDTTIDVSRMFDPQPSPAVGSVLNACYRRSRRLIKENEGAFCRLVVRLIRDWHVDHFALIDIFGER